MKKNVIFSLIVSAVINGICLFINLISGILFKQIPLGITISGGEWTGKYGFGVLLETIYPLTTVADSNEYINISLNVESFLIPFIVVSVIVLILKTIINNKKTN